MSHEAMTWAMYQAPSVRTEAGKRDATARQVLFVFAEKADAAGMNSFPSPELIAEATDLEVRTVERAIRKLVGAKLIERTGKRRSGAVVWRLNMALTRSPSDQDEVRLKQEARRLATAERVRKFREKKAAEEAAKAAAAESSARSVTPSDCVTGARSEDVVAHSECVSNGSDGGCVTHSECERNAVKVRSVTQSTPCEPPLGTVLDSPSGCTLPPDPLRPQAPPSSGLGTEYATGAFDGSTVQKLDHEGCVDRAHTRVGTHAREATWTDVRCEHGLTVYSRPDEACCFLGRLGVPADSMRLVPGAS